MNYTMLKGKIHRAVVKQADLNYVGSITVDTKLLEAAGILEYEMVQIVDVENGNRFETYTIAGEPGFTTARRSSGSASSRSSSTVALSIFSFSPRLMARIWCPWRRLSGCSKS